MTHFIKKENKICNKHLMEMYKSIEDIKNKDISTDDIVNSNLNKMNKLKDYFVPCKNNFYVYEILFTMVNDIHDHILQFTHTTKFTEEEFDFIIENAAEKNIPYIKQYLCNVYGFKLLPKEITKTLEVE